MSKVKVRVEGHYDVREIPYGKDYVWRPAHALVECDCGRVLDVDARHATCPDCGGDCSGLMAEIKDRHLGDEVLHPWHPDYERWVEFRSNHAEYHEWLEQRELQ